MSTSPAKGTPSADDDRSVRRLVRRETSASRSVSVVVAMTFLVLVAVTVAVAAVVVLLGQRIAGVDPRDVVDAAVRAPTGLVDAVVVAVGAVLALLGLWSLLHGLLPARRPRHVVRSDRLGVVVDDEVLASAAARAARSATRLGPDAAVGSVGRRALDVVLLPASGVDVDEASAAAAVDRELAAVDVVPPLTARVRVRTTGRIDG
ncbi:hypothetical protein DEJ16_03095 [Curtobacterium sp. MCJR17_055]|uniref:hypothetical protein n=1 Tax=unclassified Curtobacterium TaxID=257496 RepID=UPI000D90D3BC|nr:MULTISPECIES: hypothetical protein [unclassified Curtobacterium]PYY33860.1 hypothetical protein DEI87_11465 [Curtobacterium sp. MCBD17_029]PYY39134.1 hypothetical protein DEJ32_09360 [Curtobacterium sp. MCPF17_046]PYY58669.1 hypothetical protein DEJ16_03095 [Curtobacterium sp. MCJR17_055]PYY59789.1 hypothetical protein DEJ26_07810 [Curtobacterium sp. MCPF17_015]PZE91649.1 hypothetical protein DEI95_09725 [Curtobacterium sp. MCBD17_008]